MSTPITRSRFIRTNLEYIRRKRGWTQEQMGLVTRIPQCWISYFEIGRGLPDAAQLKRLAAALDLPPDQVLATPPIEQQLDETIAAKMRVANAEHNVTDMQLAHLRQQVAQCEADLKKELAQPEAQPVASGQTVL